MKYLLSGVAIVAALAMAAPASAQRTGPGAGASTTTGPTGVPPGGPGPSSPMSNLPPKPGEQYPPPSAATPPGAMGTTSATPPGSRPARATKGKMAARGGGRAPTPDHSANQLNADELARLQAGNFGNPPPSAMPYGRPPGR